jgi:hypothetical protein
VAAGTAQLFPVEPDGVIVTRLVQEPGRLVCLVWLASGDLEPLLERYVDIEAWAAREGAVAMRIQGRAGWLRVLPGFKQTGVILEKELGNGQGEQNRRIHPTSRRQLYPGLQKPCRRRRSRKHRSLYKGAGTRPDSTPCRRARSRARRT